MATKTSQIVIDVQDKSLQELNDEIKSLETTIQSLKVGTQEWNQANQQLGGLKSQFSQATGEAKKLQAVVADVSGSRQGRAIAEMGRGIVGAFAGVSGAITLLGGNKKDFDEITAKATTFLSIMMGLREISIAFSAANINALKNVGQSFGTLVRTVKTASTAIKISLLSTGILALVVGVGLLIANFDKLKNLVSGKNAKDKKDAEENLKLAQTQQKIEEERAKQSKNRLDANSQLLTQEQKSADNAKLNLDAKKKELETTQAQGKLDQINYDQITALFGKEKQKEKQTEQQQVIDINKAQQETLATEIALLDEEAKRLDLLAEIADSQKKYTKAIAESENKLIVLNSELYKSQEIYQEEIKLIDTKLAAAWDKINKSAAGTSLEELKVVDTLEAQKTALTNQNEIRKLQLSVDMSMLEIELRRNKTIDLLNQYAQTYTAELKKQTDEETLQGEKLKNNDELIALDLKGMQDGRKIRDEIVNFDLKRNKILNDRLVDLYPSELKVTQQIYNSIKNFLAAYTDNVGYKSLDFFANKVKELTDNFKTDLQLQAGLNKEYDKRSRYGKQLIDDAAQELALKKISSDFTVEALGKQIDAIEKQKTLTKGLIVNDTLRKNALLTERDALLKQLDPYLKIIAADDLAIKNGTKRKINDEQRYDIEQKINKLSSDTAGTEQDINSITDSIYNSDKEINDLTLKENDLIYQQSEAVDSVETAQTEISDTLQDQLRLSAKLQDFTTKYADEIAASQKAMTQSIEFIATLQDNKAKEAQTRIDAYTQQLSDLNDKETDRKKELLDLEAELQDANGERYDELVARMAQVRGLEAQDKKIYDDTEAKKQADIKKRNKAEHDAAVWRKAEAVIDAVIQGALAVIKALPNVFLSIAVGIASAAEVATIVAQKIPDAPVETADKSSFATGGIRKKAGLIKVGEKGFELAHVPAGTRIFNHEDSVRMLNSGVRLGGSYAEGGYVQPALTTGSNEFIDYERLIQGIANANRLLPAPIVQVQKITTAQQEVAVTKKMASMSR